MLCENDARAVSKPTSKSAFVKTKPACNASDSSFSVPRLSGFSIYEGGYLDFYLHRLHCALDAAEPRPRDQIEDIFERQCSCLSRKALQRHVRAEGVMLQCGFQYFFPFPFVWNLAKKIQGFPIALNNKGRSLRRMLFLA